MKVFVINLERSPERKLYMQEVLKHFPTCLDVEFVTAVDGKTMSLEERFRKFDEVKFKNHYGVPVRPSEIGVTLSHQKCYRKMIAENLPYVLIMEDDIAQPIGIDMSNILGNLGKEMQTDVPRIILLSGWYWYYNTSHFFDMYKLANVYSGFLAHAYLINIAAAKLLVEEKPYIVADDWCYIRKKDIKLQAVLPHLIDQNWDGSIVTTVNVEERGKVRLLWKLSHAPYLLFLKFLKLIGHFEKA